MNEPVYRIRGHHLLCMLGFRGLGYSDEFVQNMGRVVDRVLGDNATRLELLDRPDAICAACPHLCDDRCAKSRGDKSPGEGDRAVLTHLGFASGDQVSAGDVYQRVAERVGVEDVGTRFCRKCEWRDTGYCTEGLAELKARTQG